MVDYERRLLVLVGLIALAFLPLLAASLVFLAQVSTAQDRLDALYARTVILAHELRGEKMRQNSLVPVIVLTGDAAPLGELKRSNRQFDALLGELRGLARDADAHAALDTVAALQRRLLTMQDTGLAMRLNGASSAGVNAYFQRNAVPLSADINQAIDRFTAQASAGYQAERTRSQRVMRGVFWVLAVASVCAFAFCAFLGRLLLRLVERKRAYDEAAARLAAREKTISLARKEAVEVVAHDLNNPITTILFASENLLAEPDLDRMPRTRAAIDNIRLATETMRRLIRNILDHSKIEAGGLVLSKETVDLRRLLADVAGQFEVSAARKGVAFSYAPSAAVDGDDHGPLLEADGARLEQVVANLLSNAIKFTAPGGRVSLTSEVSGDGVVVEVRDTGWGMTQEQAARIFDRNWQSDAAAPHGNGLGLTISKAIVEAHGGRLGVDSRPGEGSAFRMVLPLAA
ncbi:MAG: HAMP domain-containing sensor histidine kinase [Caulobacter sp.]